MKSSEETKELFNAMGANLNNWRLTEEGFERSAEGLHLLLRAFTTHTGPSEVTKPVITLTLDARIGCDGMVEREAYIQHYSGANVVELYNRLLALPAKQLANPQAMDPGQREKFLQTMREFKEKQY